VVRFLPVASIHLYDLLRVLGGEGGVDQDRVALAGDQRDRGGRPGRLALAHRGYQAGDGLVRGDEYVEVQWTGHGVAFQVLISQYTASPVGVVPNEG